MITPNIRYYAKMEDSTGIKGLDGKVSMFLQVSKESGSKKDNAPSMKLQAKNSLNFTGLKEYLLMGN